MNMRRQIFGHVNMWSAHEFWLTFWEVWFGSESAIAFMEYAKLKFIIESSNVVRYWYKNKYILNNNSSI